MREELQRAPHVRPTGGGPAEVPVHQLPRPPHPGGRPPGAPRLPLDLLPGPPHPRPRDYPRRPVRHDQPAPGRGHAWPMLYPMEKAGRIPSLVLSPMMVEDGRRLLISNLDLDALTANEGPLIGPEKGQGRTASRKDARPTLCSAVEFFRLFPKAHPTFRVGTAVRMNATFPYVSPVLNLPTDPDAGLRRRRVRQLRRQPRGQLDPPERRVARRAHFGRRARPGPARSATSSGSPRPRARWSATAPGRNRSTSGSRRTSAAGSSSSPTAGRRRYGPAVDQLLPQ